MWRSKEQFLDHQRAHERQAVCGTAWHDRELIGSDRHQRNGNGWHTYCHFAHKSAVLECLVDEICVIPASSDNDMRNFGQRFAETNFDLRD
jgi:hypothetical protein